MTPQANAQFNQNAETVARGLPENCHVRHCYIQEEPEVLRFKCDCGREVPGCELDRNAGLCDQCAKFGGPI